MAGHRNLPSLASIVTAPLLVLLVLLLPLMSFVSGCTYYEVTRPDGSTERISRAEYEEIQRTSNRLGNVPALGRSSKRTAEPKPNKPSE